MTMIGVYALMRFSPAFVSVPIERDDLFDRKEKLSCEGSVALTIASNMPNAVKSFSKRFQRYGPLLLKLAQGRQGNPERTDSPSGSNPAEAFAHEGFGLMIFWASNGLISGYHIISSYPIS